MQSEYIRFKTRKFFTDANRLENRSNNVKDNHVYALSNDFRAKPQLYRKLNISRALQERGVPQQRQLQKDRKKKYCRTHQHVTRFSDVRVVSFISSTPIGCTFTSAREVSLHRRARIFLAHCWSLDALIPRVAEPSGEQIHRR